MTEVAVRVHDVDQLKAGFEHFEIPPEKRLEIFVLVQTHPGIVGG